MTSSPASEDLSAYFAALTHPRRDEALALCALIRAGCPQLQEGIKWNAPNYAGQIQGDCQTLRLHPAPAFQLVLHRGAKILADAPPHPATPKDLVVWKSADRGVVDFAKRTLDSVADDLTALIRAWVQI